MKTRTVIIASLSILTLSVSLFFFLFGSFGPNDAHIRSVCRNNMRGIAGSFINYTQKKKTVPTDKFGRPSFYPLVSDETDSEFAIPPTYLHCPGSKNRNMYCPGGKNCKYILSPNASYDFLKRPYKDVPVRKIEGAIDSNILLIHVGECRTNSSSIYNVSDKNAITGLMACDCEGAIVYIGFSSLQERDEWIKKFMSPSPGGPPTFSDGQP